MYRVFCLFAILYITLLHVARRAVAAAPPPPPQGRAVVFSGIAKSCHRLALLHAAAVPCRHTLVEPPLLPLPNFSQKRMEKGNDRGDIYKRQRKCCNLERAWSAFLSLVLVL